jgi:hypothetical protein
VEELNVVARGEPFQFTTETLSKFEPMTVSVNPVGLHAGVAGIDVVDAEIALTTGNVPRAGLIVKFTTLDTSVVVVALILEDPETAEPGIWTAIWMVPAAATYEAGTGAVTTALLTYVVGSGI